ncbi:hypothetical protein FQN57_006780 [Myotisia sp. PD_48]|nr:hypothetical protein FQN57_006780 [Myotisia sp. PD_48]
MAGIPRTSKGCNTCRKRKKGCDLKRPSCGQCLKRKVPCGGYEREVKFINTSSETHQQAQEQQSSQKPKAAAAKLQGREALYQITTCHSFKCSQANSNVSCQKSAVLDACLSFFFTNFTSQAAKFKGILPNCEESSFLDWISIVPQLNTNHPILRSALLALGMARTGRSVGDSRLVSESSRFYNSALQSFRKVVHQTKGGSKNETIASMMFLSLYEVLEGSSMRGFGWASHIEAASQFILSQGCQGEWSDLWRRLFLGLRQFAIIRAIGKRKQTFLATPEWAYVPWMHAQKPHQHRLLDLMSMIPSRLEDLDTIERQTTIGETEIQRLIDVCNRTRELVNELHLWHRMFQADNGHRLHWEEPSTLIIHSIPENSSPEIQRLSSTCFKFRNVDIGQSELLYWTSVMVAHNNLWLGCNRILARTDFKLVNQQDRPGFLLLRKGGIDEPCGETLTYHLSFPSNPGEIMTFARNIGRSLEYFIQPDLIPLTATGIAFPCAMASGFFKHFNFPECAWFKTIFEHVRQLSGIDLQEFLAAMVKEGASQAVK